MSKVTVRLKGGLGNQMFQYAAARSVSEKNGGGVVSLNLSFLAQQHRYAPREFELGFLDPGHGRLEIEPRPKLGALKWRARSVVSKIGNSGRFFREEGPSFDEKVLSLTSPIHLDGYFQSERYFSHISAEIRSEFRFRENLVSAETAKLYEKTLGQKILAIHVRRGDYVSDDGARKVLGALPLDYYRRALEKISVGSFDDVNVFTDDPDWVMEEKIFADFKVVSSRSRKAIHDVWLMSAAHSFIIANSSFSWWAAWLGHHTEKNVIAPKPWFLESNETPHGLIPEAWDQLDR